MSKILIFTNKDSMESISILRDSAKKAWGDDFACFPEDDKPIYRCDFSPEGPAKLTPETSCEKEGVYLIFDLIDETSAKALAEPCSEGEVLVLYHSHTKPDVVETFANLANPNRLLLKGQHEETHPELFYYPIFSTLLDEEGNKYSRIRNMTPTTGFQSRLGPARCIWAWKTSTTLAPSEKPGTAGKPR